MRTVSGVTIAVIRSGNGQNCRFCCQAVIICVSCFVSCYSNSLFGGTAAVEMAQRLQEVVIILVGIRCMIRAVLK